MPPESATPTVTPALDAILAAVALLTEEEKAVLVARVGRQASADSASFPHWEMDIVSERLRRLDDGLDQAIPLQEAFEKLDHRWARKS